MTDLLTDRMFAQAAAWQMAGDRRAIFLDCYARMTANMLRGIDAGRFYDGVWVEALLHRFAAYYFQALAGHEQTPDAVPAPWRLAFAAAAQPETHTLQHLFLGVNAHINYDLVLALNDLLREEWPMLSEEIRRQRHEDHSLVNRIIAETIDAVQDEVVELYTPALALLDAGLTRLDEWLIARLIARWREEVWRQGVTLVQLADPAAQEALRRETERKAEARATTILLGERWATLL